MSNNNVDYASMRFYCDENRCIHCDGCSVACAEAHELPVEISRRKVVTVNEGKQGLEFSLSVACMHCTDAPCEQVCPVDCFYIRQDGIVLHDKNKCIGCSYCLYACPFGAPQFPKNGAFGTKGVMDKCTMCAGGPLETNSEHERELYGQNRISEGRVPVCAAMCSTKALLVGDAESVSNIFRERVMSSGHGVQSAPYGWDKAYGK
ncbi:formate dehydrogenase FDH3 subunit beta [Poseidonibacter lekithochrous]|uniref:formate dehydrogenase FDH3 subunit beta n=1 Tax=Poseidonibacter TaxID=2321187 RepID=UPI001C0934AE|nr:MULTISPECIES: formate dehydrogenase FDH3 subunit beta [Poseidonibacter]MBU3013204.1 formate dehydrogenase FDH3 subunit beta [Poseidonibacter lekithochrous]MDO6826500.1 formate dehydrogenase FDH3 subunit beta [Poseidonibacter sp. 1_MG-2023]